jgi:hypothetical protein
MFIRLWFWTEKNPKPHVIATGTGKTLAGAMAGCFAPVDDRTWKREIRDGKLYLTRGNTGYCGEIVGRDEIVMDNKPVRSMRVVRRAGGWCVTGVPNCDDCGPYRTKEEAEDTRRGLQRTYDHIDDSSFFTSERPQRVRVQLSTTPVRPRLTLEPTRPRLKLARTRQKL